MKYSIQFQKKKGLFLKEPNVASDSTELVKMIVHTLMDNGYYPNNELLGVMIKLPSTELSHIFKDFMSFLSRVVGSDGYKKIYSNFPEIQEDLVSANTRFESLKYYRNHGVWNTEDLEDFKKETKRDYTDLKELSLLKEVDYLSIYLDILYSGSSISSFDKEILTWGIANKEVKFSLSRIKFNETKAFVGKLLLNDASRDRLPTKDATLVLRMYSAYSGGDEGLKENTRFIKPKAFQKTMLKNTLNQCYNLEESFKLYREKWLRVLFYLNPMTPVNKTMYANLYNYTLVLRNSPKLLKTFNSKVEDFFKMKDARVFDLLSKRPGAFTRKLDHCVRVFGYVAIERWLGLNHDLNNLITAYNHFINRDKKGERSAVLASQSSSTVVSYESLAPLDSKLVKKITTNIIGELVKHKNKEKVYIDRSLFYRPLSINNRASSLSLSDNVIGTTEVLPVDNIIRAYVHWEGGNDIDLSAMCITSENKVLKVGWNGMKNHAGMIIYSGDNTGNFAKNSEYIDINLSECKQTKIEWIILDSYVYTGLDYSDWSTYVRAGWMSLTKEQAGKPSKTWNPSSLENSSIIRTKSRNSYLCAIHVPSNNIVYLDVSSHGNNNISNGESALKMRQYLDKVSSIDKGSDKIDWSKINQGHVLYLLYNVVDSLEEADIVFDDKTNWETVSYLLNK